MKINFLFANTAERLLAMLKTSQKATVFIHWINLTSKTPRTTSNIESKNICVIVLCLRSAPFIFSSYNFLTTAKKWVNNHWMVLDTSNKTHNQYGNFDQQSYLISIHKPRRPIKQGLYMLNEFLFLQAAKMDKNFKFMYP